MTLDELIQRHAGKRTSTGAMFKCPSHKDQTASLHVSQGADKLLLRCHAGCTTPAVLSAWGLTWADVSPEREAAQRPAEKRTTYSYEIPGGVLEHIRIEGEAGKRYVWTRDGKSGLNGFKLEGCPLWIPSRRGLSVAVICEGEKAADAAAELGLRAYGTATGASSAPSVEILAQFKGQPVVIWPDNDAPGKKHALMLAQRLEGIASSVKLVAWGEKLGDDAADFLARGGTPEQARALVDLAKPAKPDPLVMVADAVKGAVAELDRLDIGDWSRHLSTGILSLDRKLMGGLRFGETTLIGAPTGAGKTTLVVQLAMAAQEKGLVVIVSPEMSARALTEREIVRRSGCPKDDRAPWAEPWRRERAREAHARAMSELIQSPPNVAIYDSMSVTMDEVAAAVRVRAAREKVVMIALDYAQQLAEIEGQERRDLAVGRVAHRAIEMAREFDCHVIVTSQVNTKLEGKTRTYTFRESAQLEQKADSALLFIVEWDPETRRPLSSFFQTTKMRDNAQFRLEVEFDAKTFQVNSAPEREMADVVEMKDWSR